MKITDNNNIRIINCIYQKDKNGIMMIVKENDIRKRNIRKYKNRRGIEVEVEIIIRRNIEKEVKVKKAMIEKEINTIAKNIVNKSIGEMIEKEV